MHLSRDRFAGEARPGRAHGRGRSPSAGCRPPAYADAAHAVAFEEFEALGRILSEEVLPETYPGR